MYKRMDFYPENKKHSDIVENPEFFNTFNGYPDWIFGEETSDYEKHVNIFKGVATNVLGTEKAFEQFCYIVGYKIKYPSRKKPFWVYHKGETRRREKLVVRTTSKDNRIRALFNVVQH